VARGASLRVLLAGLITVFALALGACDNPPPPAERLHPKITPPAIKTAGVLRAGVDLSYPPFAGIEDAKKAGIDVEVASAIAGRLGLEVEFVDVKASQVATALAEHDVDIALSAPFSADVITRASIAGTYLSDGPVMFVRNATAALVTTDSVLASDGMVVAAQRDSEAYWIVVGERGPDGVKAYPTLRAAFDALDSGEVSAVACDALVGAYIARDRTGVRYLGALGPARLLGVALATDRGPLAEGVSATLDKLVSDGAIDAIRSAWVGPLPKLPLPADDASQTSDGATETP
jgi:ABC-type amino acid transport substrate-binding protein